MPAAALTKPELFARIAEGHAAGVTVVTPNLRLAQELGRAFDRYQLARGLALWDAPDILSFTAFVSRAYEDLLYSDLADHLPVVLAPAEEQAVWEDIVGRSEESARLLALPQAAAAARDAWKTAHEWRLLDGLGRARRNEDTEAFAGWAERYSQRTQRDGHTEAARLPDVVAALLAEPCLKKPALLVRYAFDIVTSQQAAFFETFAMQGSAIATCGPRAHEGKGLRVRCIDAQDELRHAARWARLRLEENPAARIGVVVPDLAGQRNAVRRIFTQVMGAGAPPLNISLGEPLSARPLVDAALLLFELCGREIAFERASRLVRSPFIAAGETERAQRAQLDAWLRRKAEPELSLDRLVTLLEVAQAKSKLRAPVLAQKLVQLAEFRKARLFAPQSPVDWGRAFSDALTLVGFPGERSLDSTEYQSLKKFHDLLAGFVQLERVTARMRYAEAVARLRRMAADTAFQPESQVVPVQVLGVLESAGCEFDHLWVMGLSVESWPLAARPNPFLPLALQREAGIPESSADLSLELDRRITKGWLSSADEVVLSHPAREADRELAASPLIAEVPEGTIELPSYPVYRDVIFASRRLERVEDAAGPPLAGNESRAGTALFGDQSACPFRAFAIHRLGSEGLETPHAGLDALERGSLVHHVLALAWAKLETKHGLDGIAAEDLDVLLGSAAEDAVARHRRARPTTLSGRFAEIEKRRLARLAREWLEHERGRGDFTVFAIESKREIAIGGLRLRGRLDRVDETADGKRIVLDYKTGAKTAGAWVGERPDEPQLPLYLTTTEPDAKAIAFAQVRTGDMKFVALAAGDGILPEARTLPDGRLKRAADTWEGQLEAWRTGAPRACLCRRHGDGESQVARVRLL